MKEPTPFHKLPRVEDGAPMPTAQGILLDDHNARMAAQIGSEGLRDAIRKLLGLTPWR
jgi:hypothetical protein